MWWWPEYKTVLHDPSLDQYQPSLYIWNNTDYYDFRENTKFMTTFITLTKLPHGRSLYQIAPMDGIKFVVPTYEVCIWQTQSTLRVNRLSLKNANVTWESKFPTNPCGGRFHVQMFQPCDIIKTPATVLSPGMS